MPEDPSSLSRVVEFYKSRGNIEGISGDYRKTARAWLGTVQEDAPGVERLIQEGFYRLAYTNAYDLYRKSAEAVVTYAGIRVSSNQGHHEVVFALANAIDESVSASATGAFAGARANQARQQRTSKEYVADDPTDTTEDDARRIYRWTTEALEAAIVICGSSLPPISI